MSTPGQVSRFCLVAVDLKGYGDLSNDGQAVAQEQLYQILGEAAAHAGVKREQWHTQWTGDGEVALVPPDVSEDRLISDFTRELDTALGRYNRDRVADARLRVRVALHHGVAAIGRSGFPGEAVVYVNRLLDAPPVKNALAENAAANLVVVVSDRLYGDIVKQRYRDLRPSDFTEVVVDLPEKRFRAMAWLRVSGRHGGDAAPRRAEPTSEPGSAHPPQQRDRPSPAQQTHYNGSIHIGDNIGRDKNSYNRVTAPRPEPDHGQF